MPETYIRNAEEAEALSRKAENEQERAMYLEIARTWRKLAEVKRKKQGTPP